MVSGSDTMNTILAQEEKRLSTELNNIRENYEHAGIEGTKVERVLRDLLRLCIPADLSVGHGEVFDTDGRQSKQTDVVVARQHYSISALAMHCSDHAKMGMSLTGHFQNTATVFISRCYS